MQQAVHHQTSTTPADSLSVAERDALRVLQDRKDIIMYGLQTKARQWWFRILRSHGCKNFASALQRPLPLQLKILQRGHTHFFIEAPPARCSKFGKLSIAYILLFCLSLFSFVSRFSLAYYYISHSRTRLLPPPPPLSLSLLVSLF